MNTSRRWIGYALTAVSLAGLADAAHAGDGLTAPGDAQRPRFQTRLSIGLQDTDRYGFGTNAGAPGLNVRSASVMGDYYFARSTWTDQTQGGFRATGGVVFGGRSDGFGAFATAAQPSSGVQRDTVNRYALAALNPDAGGLRTMPYVGVGYTMLNGRSGWGFSADLGLVTPGIKLNRLNLSTTGADDPLRDTRVAPLLQLGVSYSF